jgi:hypothetical protein
VVVDMDSVEVNHHPKMRFRFEKRRNRVHFIDDF